MFSWHETTWRNLCRAAFGLFVVLPTCAALAAAIWCRTPLSLEYHRRTLGPAIGSDVRIARVSFPRPGVTLYQDLALDDPETSRPLFRSRSLEWRDERPGLDDHLLAGRTAGHHPLRPAGRAVASAIASAGRFASVRPLRGTAVDAPPGRRAGPANARRRAWPVANAGRRATGHVGIPSGRRPGGRPVRISLPAQFAAEPLAGSITIETGPTPCPRG